MKPSLIQNIATCKTCGIEIDGMYGSGVFCSRACANTRQHSDETKAKTSKAMKDKLDFSKYVEGTKELYMSGIIPRKRLKYYLPGLVDGVDFISCPYCGLRVAHLQQKHLDVHSKTKDDVFQEFGEDYQMVSKNLSSKKAIASSEVQQKLISEHRHVGWQSRSNKSYAEQFWQNVLDNNSIKYEDEHVVHKRDLGIGDASNYFLDFLIDGFIDLEVDGKQHEYEDRAESDKERDRLLKKYGFVVYRIPWINPNNDRNKQKVKEQIDEFLVWYQKIRQEEGIIVY